MSIAVFCGLVIFVLLAVMLLAGVPIAIALAVSSICAILPVLNLGASVLTGAQRIFSGISVFSLLAIPFFILAGNIMNKGGIAIRLINFAKLFTGSIPGALAHTNAVANMLFGAISGSGTAAASAMGSIIGPIEEEEGYDRDFSAAANIATAPTGLLIPPSNVMITFSLVSGGTSVAALFMAGYIPGILWGLACMVVIYFFARKKGYRSTKRYTGSEKVKVFFQAIPCLFMIIVVIGGIISGIFTATEGSVVAVVYSMVLSIFFYKSIRLRDDRHYHLPYRSIQHHELGHGLHRHPHRCIGGHAGNQHQPLCDSFYYQHSAADCGNLYGHDACLPYLHPYFPSHLPGAGHEYHTLWNHDDIQPLHRHHHSSGGNYTLRGSKGGKDKNRTGYTSSALLLWRYLYRANAGILYTAAVAVASGTHGLCIKHYI